MARTARAPRGPEVFDQLGLRMRAMVREVHVNELSGVLRFTVLSVNPFQVGELQGELVLEDGDPDFTVGEGLRSQLAAGGVSVDDLVWVARSDQEWHAFDTVGPGTGFKPGGPPTGAAGGDLGGSYPNPTVVTINGRAVSAVVFNDDARLSNARVPTGAAGGALSGNYPNPTLNEATALAELGWHGPYDTGVLGIIAAGNEQAATINHNLNAVGFQLIAVGQLYDGNWSGLCTWRAVNLDANNTSIHIGNPSGAQANMQAGWRGYLKAP